MYILRKKKKTYFFRNLRPPPPPFTDMSATNRFFYTPSRSPITTIEIVKFVSKKCLRRLKLPLQQCFLKLGTPTVFFWSGAYSGEGATKGAAAPPPNFKKVKNQKMKENREKLLSLF